MKKRTQTEPHAVNGVEIPQEVADRLFEVVILPRLLEEYFDADADESIDTGDTMERDASLGGLA